MNGIIRQPFLAVAFREFKGQHRAGRPVRIANGHFKLDRLLIEDPEYTGAYFNLGLVFKALGMRNTAVQFFRTYLDIEPDGYHKERTLKELAEKEAKVVVLAHQGRPGKDYMESLEQHAELASGIVKMDYVDDLGEKAKERIEKMENWSRA